MSLINDALKRAKEAQKQPAPSPRVATPLQPIEQLRRPGQGSGGTPWLIPVVLLALGLLGGGLIWGWFRSRSPQTQSVAAVTTVNTPAPVIPAAPPAPAPLPVVNPAAPTPVRSTVQINTTLVTRATVPPRPNPPVVPVAAPTTPAAAVPRPMPEATPVKVVAAPTQPIEAAAPVGPTTLPAVVTPAPVAVAPPVTPAPVAAHVLPAVPVAPTPKRPFPELKLQGIFYRPNNSSALISGRNLYVGDDVEGSKVISIDRSSVKVESGGETRVLRLR